MIEKVTIENYKSIHYMELPLGRVNVLIGENGCGKSNILEAVGLLSAAAERKLDNEFLVSRGIRVTEDPIFMRSAFEKKATTGEIKLFALGNMEYFECELENDNQPYSKWTDKSSPEYWPKNNIILRNRRESLEEEKGERGKRDSQLLEDIRNSLGVDNNDDAVKILQKLKLFLDIRATRAQKMGLNDYVIYSPENKALRTFEREEQLEPLGINGEGLLKLLKYFRENEEDKLKRIIEEMKLLDWFDDIEIPDNLEMASSIIRIKDRYLDEALPYFSQRSANEGFLFLLFYFALFISEKTPTFFAIDNIEASLNPKLCTELIKKIVTLSKDFGKQVILTTHSPAVLDGLNLDDPMQKLFVVSRKKNGHTRVRNITKPQPAEGVKPMKLSQMFLSGILGGLPKGF